ncbi:hypothetical protein [Streptomyces sp. NPDC049813]|uniref:hypothetical protein n=1 Tax=Streptomyces sp. NPDC049813 TaxID=3365597 RepID=UPI0037A9DB93
MGEPSGGRSPIYMAVLAGVVLVGHYVLALLVLGALAAIDYAFATSGHAYTFGAAGVYAGSVALAWALCRSFWPAVRAERGRRDEVPGVRLEPADHPDLWRRVRALAAQAATEPPARIWLTAEVNAQVRERRRLLGLRRG